MDDINSWLFGLSPGLVGALASGLFVSKSTWTTRAVGFVVTETVVVGSALMFFCSMSGPNGRSLSKCAVDVPVGLVRMVLPSPSSSP